MPGDYTRLTYEPHQRYVGAPMQQGRVQLDADWNEAQASVNRRIRLQALDTLGPFGIAQPTPDAFLVKIVTSPGLDLSLEPGRIYVDGILAELFPDETASYFKQPFFPDPPPLPQGGAVVFLDLWNREVTYIEDPSLLDPALGGVDTATRVQSVWQLRVDGVPDATCGMPVGILPSAGRLTTTAVAPPAPEDPCILPPVAGYRGLENRLYRIEVHNGGPLGTARFKWSRDDGSIVAAVSAIAVSGSETTLTLDRLGRDQVLRFDVGNWVTVTDDFREFALETGDMAQIIQIDEANTTITLDRALPVGTGRPFGTNTSEIAARHTRVQRWDQSAAINTLDADGLMTTTAGPIDIEDGIQVSFSIDPAGGEFHNSDYWVFWARTATASIEQLVSAPPRGIVHHYAQLAAVTGLGGPNPTVTDCRPSTGTGGDGGCDCCCSVSVAVGADIQDAINKLPPEGGCICLKTGVHTIRQTIVLDRSNVKLTGESPGTIVQTLTPQTVLRITDAEDVVVEGITFRSTAAGPILAPAPVLAPLAFIPGPVLDVLAVRRLLIQDCAFEGPSDRQADSLPGLIGARFSNTGQLVFARCLISGMDNGILIANEGSQELSFQDNILDLGAQSTATFAFGIWAIDVGPRLRVKGNFIRGVPRGIVVNDNPLGLPQSRTGHTEIVGNFVVLNGLGARDVPGLGVDLAANDSIAAANAIRLAPTSAAPQIGIRLTGNYQQAVDNAVTVDGPSGDNPGTGITIGYHEGQDILPVTDVIAEDNLVRGCTFGVVVTHLSGGDIGTNTLEADKAIGTGFGIGLDGCAAVAVHDNRVAGYTFGVSSSSGIANTIRRNVVTGGNWGMLLTGQLTATVSDNHITNAALGGVAAISIDARTELADNRIAECAFAQSQLPLAALSVVGAFGELRVAGNEIIDTGVSFGKSVAFPVSGIGAVWILDASIESNQVTYTDPLERDPNAEDRALRLAGLTHKPVDPNVKPLAGYPAMILSNKFVGPGLSSLVEFLPAPDGVGFDRVTFSNNFCWHFLGKQPDLKTSATVRLLGTVTTVMGNHIKSGNRDYACLDFNNMPGPFIGNIFSGVPIGRTTDFPSHLADFNTHTL
jgi:hypothetical protein